MTEVLEKRWDDMDWAATGSPGLAMSVLRENGRGGASFFLKFDAGYVGAPHTHPEGEELYVVSGDVTVGGRRLKTGDYLYTPPDGIHHAEAHAETVLLLVTPKLPVFL